MTQIASPIAAGTTPDRIAVNPSGTLLYATNFFGASISLYTIASGTGPLTTNGAPISTGSSLRPQGVVVHPNGQFLIVTNNSALATTNNVVVYSIGGTGLLTLAGSATAGVTPSGVTLDPTGSYVYVSNTGSASISRFAFNQTTGELTSPAPNTFATGSLPRFLFSCLTPQ